MTELILANETGELIKQDLYHEGILWVRVEEAGLPVFINFHLLSFLENRLYKASS